MKIFLNLLFFGALPILLMAQNKPPVFLQKMLIKDSIYQPQRQMEFQENNGIPLVDEQAIKEPADNHNSPMLQATRDPYGAIAGFQFSTMHLVSKGLANADNKVLVNGHAMMDLATGAGFWSSWNGLNAIFRISETSSVFQQSDAGVSILGSVANIDIRPFKQKAGLDLGYGIGNIGATQKFFLGFHSGISKKGWSLGMGMAARKSFMPIRPGIQNQGGSIYLAMDKKIGASDIISFAVFGSQLQSDRQASILLESATILNDNQYNPAWGYQNGQSRNANKTSQSLPIWMLTEEHRFSNQSFLQTSIAYVSGFKNNTGLDWYHAPDPRPDYYRYLPSYQSDPAIQQSVMMALQSNMDLRQLNWDRFYQINRNSYDRIENANGILGNSVSGLRARYVLENRHQELQKMQFASTYHGLISEDQFFSAGVIGQWQQSQYFKTIEDLLGADFYVNWNQFAESEIPNDPQAIQFDLGQPNRILRVGNRFGYDYQMHHLSVGAWFQTGMQKGKWGYAISMELAGSSYWREGLVTNGLFPLQSLGSSKRISFLNKGLKLAFNHVVNARSRIYFSAAIQSRPPNAENVFLSPRTRNEIADQLLAQDQLQLEIGYLVQSPNVKSRLSLYWSQLKNGMDLLSFYHDGYNSFVNYAISGIGERHLGIEWGLDARMIKEWHFQGAVFLGDFIYNSRQMATMTVDNTAALLNQVVIYAKHHPIGGTPQQAISIGFNHRSNQQWFWAINANFFDRQWMVWNPIRRTAEALYPLDPDSDKGKQLLYQERIPAQTVLNFYISKRVLLHGPANKQLDFSLSVKNLLNKRDLIISAAEQLRFDFDNRNAQKFAPKYFFGQGISGLFSINYHF